LLKYDSRKKRYNNTKQIKGGSDQAIKTTGMIGTETRTEIVPRNARKGGRTKYLANNNPDKYMIIPNRITFNIRSVETGSFPIIKLMDANMVGYNGGYVIKGEP
jgi:hypothetical protein